MGSVMDFSKCGNCQTEDSLMSDYYYKTGEEYVFCSECGFTHDAFWKRDENGKFASKDPEKGYKFDNFIPETNVIENPFGAYKIESKGNGASVGAIADEKQYNSFLRDIGLMDKSGVASIVVSRLINGEIVKEVVFG